MVIDKGGEMLPILQEEWSRHRKDVTKGKATADSGVTTDMLKLPPRGGARIIQGYRKRGAARGLHHMFLEEGDHFPDRESRGGGDN